MFVYNIEIRSFNPPQWHGRKPKGGLMDLIRLRIHGQVSGDLISSLAHRLTSTKPTCDNEVDRSVRLEVSLRSPGFSLGVQEVDFSVVGVIHYLATIIIVVLECTEDRLMSPVPFGNPLDFGPLVKARSVWVGYFNIGRCSGRGSLMPIEDAAFLDLCTSRTALDPADNSD